jgi:hypothetical protein
VGGGPYERRSPGGQGACPTPAADRCVLPADCDSLLLGGAQRKILSKSWEKGLFADLDGSVPYVPMWLSGAVAHSSTSGKSSKSSSESGNGT